MGIVSSNADLRNSISKTKLRSLKYENGQGPIIQKPLPDPDASSSIGGSLWDRTKNRLGFEVERRADDAIRMTEILKRPPGLKFIRNQAILNLSGASTKIKGYKSPTSRSRQIAIGAARVAGVPASTIAQSAISGTGIRLVQGFIPNKGTYLPWGISSLFPNTNSSFNDSTVESGYEGFGDLNTEPRKGEELVEDAKKVHRENQKTVFSANDIIPVSWRSIKTSRRTGTGDTETTEEDPINLLEVRTQELDDSTKQIIPFKIVTYAEEKPEYIYFRAYLESFFDNYSGNWGATNYIGRADPVYTYDTFSRNVGFSFKVAASSRKDLEPLYKRLNRFVSTTAPYYDEDGFFKQGVFVELTIGDYIKKVPGFFESIDVTWDISYQWEVEEQGKKVPHVLDINCSFKPVHNFNPQYGENFNFIGPISEDLPVEGDPLPPLEPESELPVNSPA